LQTRRLVGPPKIVHFPCEVNHVGSSITVRNSLGTKESERKEWSGLKDVVTKGLHIESEIEIRRL
jgi:hypothetical protein